MKKTVLAVMLLLLTKFSIAQKWDKVVRCTTDTIVVAETVTKNIGKVKVDSVYYSKVVTCATRTLTGMRVDIGITPNYFYNTKTAEWLGKHGGPNFNFVFVIGKFNVGLRFKPWTVNPKKALDFNGVTLPSYADLNPIKIDYFLGYSIDFERNFSLEPSLGYTKASFTVINEDELRQSYSIPSVGGLITGLTLNKYIPINDFDYFALFGSARYAFIDYTKVHQSLGNNHIEWTVGIAYKGYFKKIFNKKIE